MTLKNVSCCEEDYSHFNEASFINDFCSLDWSFMNSPNIDANLKFDMFYHKISTCVSTHAPCRKLSNHKIKLKSKPWITKTILKKIKYRDKLYSKLLKNPTNLDLAYLFKKFRNNIVNDIRNGKIQHFKTFFNSNMNNMKKVWSGIRSIININKYKNTSIPRLLIYNKSIDDPQSIANAFNTFFVNVGRSTDKDIPKCNHSPSYYLYGNYPQAIFLRPVNPLETFTIIDHINKNKSIDPNSIPIKLLKTLNNHTFISELLAVLVNDSFNSGIFQKKLKVARITPIFKKDSTLNKNNYRPISVLSVFSKIFEKLIYQRLYDYLEKYILYNLQFGFRERISTSHALISISELIRKSIDSQELLTSKRYLIQLIILIFF